MAEQKRMAQGKKKLTPLEQQAKLLSRSVLPEKISQLTLIWGDRSLTLNVDQNTGEVTSERLSLADELWNLSQFFSAQFETEEGYTAFKTCAHRAIDSSNPGIVQGLSRRWPEREHARYSQPLTQGCVALARAEQAYSCGEIDTAQRFAIEAQAKVDIVNELYKAHNQSDLASARGKKGGSTAGSHHSRAKAMCVLLLQELRPAKGWKSFEEAAEKVAPRLTTFLKENPSSGKNLGTRGNRDDLHSTIKRWLQKPGSVRDAFYGETGRTPGAGN